MAFLAYSFLLLPVNFDGSHQNSVGVSVVGDRSMFFDVRGNQRERSEMSITIPVKLDDAVLRKKCDFAFVLNFQAGSSSCRIMSASEVGSRT
jgi:hypothetical protein